MYSHQRFVPPALGTAMLVGMLATGTAAAAEEPADVRFAVPSWPGVTVKSELAGQLLEALGYTPQQQELGSTIAYEALNQDDVDVYLAAWLPGQSTSYDPAMEEGVIKDLGNNVDGARLGFAVPEYVFDAGVTSGEDLKDPEVREKLGGTIYAIEVGSGISEILDDNMEKDTYDLTQWEVSETSTPGMLSTVESALQREEWLVFTAWTPHWMNIEYDVRYLDDPEDFWGDEGGRSNVRTLVTQNFAERQPNATRLLDQLNFSADDQSAMIYGYSFDEKPADEVALTWLREHPEKVRTFVDGVTTRSGEEKAWPEIQDALEIPAP
ncbi:ABC transporter substrate-binding protein [Halomonas piscis]|uniref:ABC transporter substrate-binding protein n=1 Tax=Halomonas piscis TaxID=3031727 RepID=A0ABY9YYT1_9GAMM|nr:ABC transporter substrate-binding protein [Halomonas piscis]WNK19931.1 ABC transporter substrate-binding protein [Halomonas piscis]